MDGKVLFEAAWEGNVEVLHKMLKENPSVLIDVALSSPRESLLHVATKSGQIDFVRELINHDRELAKELSKDGFRPLDIASMMGNVELVKELVRNNHGICHLKGKDQRTALHYAAIKGRIEVMDVLLSTCPKSIVDTMVDGKSALHLSVENNQFDAFRLLVSWLERLNMEAIINSVDCDGNTVLHLAASRKQVETVELLLDNNNTISKIVEVNAINLKGLTAMDVVDIVIESPKDLHLREILQIAGALSALHANTNSKTCLQHPAKTKQAKNGVLQSKSSKDWLKYFKFQKKRDSPSEARDALLVVAALIASVTFQAGVNPPKGIMDLASDTPSNTDSAPTAVLEANAVTFIFVFANTLGLTASLSIITYLTAGFPFQKELLISMVSMMFAYGFAIASITEGAIPYVLLGAAVFVTFFHRWVVLWGRKLWKLEDKLPVTSNP